MAGKICNVYEQDEYLFIWPKTLFQWKHLWGEELNQVEV
jgi:hypothetical protein